jgi:hypothetical protein
LYLDIGAIYNDNDPANDEWRSKSTTNQFGSLELFLAMANVRKEALPGSRWGFELGLQTGLDSGSLVTEAPPPANEPIDDAETLRHLYRANFSYLFDAGRGLKLTGGLIDGFIGYESYLAIDNPNYTRGYISDHVPFFMIGLEAEWDVSETVDLGFFLTSGFNYLTSPNDVPSAGLHIAWLTSPTISFTQNLYYGPDQADTGLEFWRFLSDSIVEWERGPFLLAGAINFGTEKQAHLPGQARHDWGAGALWARWELTPRWSVALRPELYWDPEGQTTSSKQLIHAYTGTVKYTFSPRYQRLVGLFEVRFDRSTGEQGGFYSGPNNELVPNQSLVLLGLLWSLDR